jgi:phosphoribosylformylglycinamidine cyclo-ligase
MHRTFNCGIGMVVLLPRAAANAALGTLRASGERAEVIGEVVAGESVQIG